MNFWQFCEERERIRLNREAGKPRSEWTSDDVLSRFRFTNICRRHDYGSRLLETAIEWCETDEMKIHLALCYRYLGSPEWLPSALGPMETPAERTKKIRKRQDRSEVVMNTRAYQAIVPEFKSMIDFVIDHSESMTKVILASPFSQPLEVVQQLADYSRAADYYAAWFQAMETVKDIMWFLPERINPDGIVRLGPGAVTGLTEHLGRMPSRAEAQAITLEMSQERTLCPPSLKELWNHDIVEHALCEFGKYCRSARGERKGGDWAPTHG